ncbi:class E sortase [Allostreptomyces psammosilenae]|uniref:class E sortase n=1 Tax=Allostreptomyces psammosilenae TaxID=1892865 RepID=UPI001FEB646D
MAGLAGTPDGAASASATALGGAGAAAGAGAGTATGAGPGTGGSAAGAARTAVPRPRAAAPRDAAGHTQPMPVIEEPIQYRTTVRRRAGAAAAGTTPDEAGRPTGLTRPGEADGAPYAPGIPSAPDTADTVGTPDTPGAPGSAQPDGSADALPQPGGRAARRRAAQEEARRGRRGGNRRPAPAGRRGAPAQPAPKESAGVVAARVGGELFITLGVVMVLFVVYQMWWTNVRGDAIAEDQIEQLEEAWRNIPDASELADPRDPGAFEPGTGFAVIYIPKLDVRAPIAESVDKEAVLDRGLVGHYTAPLESAMPWDEEGNFALAGHRNTHGEPFRYINQLQPGDEIVVETATTYYVYEMTSMLPQTSPSDIGVIDPIPPKSGFTEPGRYITLTTCTPEFTSTYRLIVWGKMVEERPREEGKPDALLGG